MFVVHVNIIGTNFSLCYQRIQMENQHPLTESIMAYIATSTSAPASASTSIELERLINEFKTPTESQVIRERECRSPYPDMYPLIKKNSHSFIPLPEYHEYQEEDEDEDEQLLIPIHDSLFRRIARKLSSLHMFRHCCICG